MAAQLLPAPVTDRLEVWLRHHDALAPGLITGLYVVGSAVLNDWQPTSDIDIIAFSDAVPTNEDGALLRAAHLAVGEALSGIDIDGPRLAWTDVTHPPEALRRPWSLQGEFEHNNECFELNPVMWTTLARYGVPVRGPAVKSLDVASDDDRLRSFVKENTNSYWRSIAHAEEEAAADPDRTEFASAMTAWSVLGVARMLYTARTGNIASKSGAGRWIAQELPQHQELIEHALTVRREAHGIPDTADTVRACAAFVAEVVDLVTTA